MPRIRVGIRGKPEAPDSKYTNLRHESLNQEVKVSFDIGEVTYDFKFDNYFEEESTQESIFKEIMRNLVDDALEGFNSTIFAFGQTGAGKTHTISGSASGDYENRGLCARAAEYLFHQTKKVTSKSVYAIQLSVVEIYNETIIDILKQTVSSDRNTTSEKLMLMDTPEGVHIPALYLVPVSSAEECSSYLLEANIQRIVAEHKLNHRSSRSHCIYTFHITRTILSPTSTNSSTTPAEDKISSSSAEGNPRSRRRDSTSTSALPSPSSVINSKLHLVDLAGSERIAKTGSTGRLLTEAAYINRSLLYLERVVNALAAQSERRLNKRELSQTRDQHVPYRQSKLTYLLKDSLGGHGNTYLIACISLHKEFIWETMSTLRFASRMKSIESIEPVRNSDISSQQLSARHQAMLKLLQKENQILRKELIVRDLMYGMRESMFSTDDSMSCNNNSTSHYNNNNNRSRRSVVLTQQQEDSTKIMIGELLSMNPIRTMSTPPAEEAVAVVVSSADAAAEDSRLDSLLDKGFHSFAQARVMTVLLREMLWEACEGDGERVRRLVRKYCGVEAAEKGGEQSLSFEGEEGTIEGDFDDESMIPGDRRKSVKANQTLVTAGSSFAQGSIDADGNSSRVQTISEENSNGVNGGMVTDRFEEFKCGAGASLHIKYEGYKAQIKAEKRNQKELVNKVNELKGLIDLYTEQLSMQGCQEVNANDDKEGSVTGQDSNLNELLQDSKKKYKVAFTNLKDCRSRLELLEKSKKDSLTELLAAFEQCGS